MTRMSSPNGDEVLTVHSEDGAKVLATLGWTREGGSASRDTDNASSDTTRRRSPGRPRKQPSEDAEES